jgi:hypothetical protein
MHRGASKLSIDWKGKESASELIPHLFVDDTLFAEANKWLKRLDDLDFVVSPEARNVFLEKQSKSLFDELADAMTKYREARMIYAALHHHYKTAKRNYEDWLSKNNPSKGVEVSAESLQEFLAKAEEDFIVNVLPRLEFEQAPRLLAEGRERKLLAALTFLAWIDKAKTSGMIKEGDASARKLRECKSERLELENDFQDLSREYTLLEAEYSRLEYENHLLWFQSHVQPQSGR